MQTKIYINGMACVHCKESVEKALCAIAGVNGAIVDLEQKCATVDSVGELDKAVVTDAIESIGFEIEKI